MIKKLFLIIFSSIFLLSACDSVNGVNLNQMLLNNSKIKSSQNYTIATLNLSYKAANVKDPQYLKLLNLLNNMKFEVQTKMQNANTISMGGFVQIKQGKIPFQLYSDNKQMVLLLDNASKAIRIPVQQGDPNTQFVQSIQSSLLPSIVKDLPNPKHISVQTNVHFKVNGENITGYKVHAEIYADEVPALLLSFLDNLSKDQAGLQKAAAVFTKLNNVTGDPTVFSAADLKQFILDFEDQFNQALPDMKQSGAFDRSNFLVTDILLDKNFNERKSSTQITLKKLPGDNGGLEGISLHVTQQNWNVNKKVTAQKINRTKFLDENTSENAFLSTLDKKHSVLYRVIKSFN